jgi:tellurite resistance-related uncharacterized protein
MVDGADRNWPPWKSAGTVLPAHDHQLSAPPPCHFYQFQPYLPVQTPEVLLTGFLHRIGDTHTRLPVPTGDADYTRFEHPRFSRHRPSLRHHTAFLHPQHLHSIPHSQGVPPKSSQQVRQYQGSQRTLL